jgi:hypothetical protein
VECPRVLPDGWVDTSSLDGIAKGLVKPGMSDQDKVLAVYHWWRRLVFHFRNMGPDRRDTLRVINSYGYNLCGSHCGAMMVLFKHMGIKARPAFVNGAPSGEGYGGHTVEEVFYGGKWHAFDVMSNFCVLNRDDPPTIAGLAELQKDPTLVTRAVEEKRTVGGFLTCNQAPDIDYAGREQFRKLGWGSYLTKSGLKPDLRWGCLTFGYTDAAGKDHPGSLLEFWTRAANKWDCKAAGELYGGVHNPGLLDIVLKPNERWVMLWDSLGAWTEKASFPGTGPFHTCGHCDELDEVNFKYFEPYGKKDYHGAKVCYRYYANGFLEWTPRSAAEVSAAATSAGGVLTVPVKAPGPVVGIELELEGPAEAVSLKTGKKSREVWKRPEGAAGPQTVAISCTAEKRAFCEYRLTVTGAEASALKRLKTVYQLNMYALPTLFPGKNTVRVSAGTARPRGSKLIVRYEWNDGPEWKSERSVEKAFGELPADFEAVVAGGKMPRMKKLELRVEPSGAG